MIQSSTFFITDQLGRNFNLGQAWEVYLVEETVDVPDGFNTSTMVAKLVTGAVELFPRQGLATLIDDIMPNLGINLFEGFYVEASGNFWADPQKAPRETIQPTFKLVGAIEGSRYRKLLKQVPEAATWPIKDRALAIKEKNIQPDYMYVEGVTYTTVIVTGNKMGIRFFNDAEHVFRLVEEALPGAIENHDQQTYIESNIKMVFEEERKIRRQNAQRRKANQNTTEEIAHRAGIKLLT